MPVPAFIRPAALVVSALGLAALLAGCTGGSDRDSETALPTPSPAATSAAPTPEPTAPANADDEARAADCATLADVPTAASEALQSAYAQASTDPAAAVATLQDFAAGFSATRAALTSPTVQAAADDAGAAFDGLVVTVEGVVADPVSADLSALTEQATQMQNAFAAIGEICS
ncbi:hypothetical protein [Agromyces seonyuensis]|uniref:Lipoprotein n=1 Tax=Agromyces seonyuensis TaxID=2662446 RepID=A0A6I4P842_9MICO|nr:hypothetical protein [Agromyces seonyuensis]MWC00048.1 hypothetical protein [Agromyces seonyuensis]